MGRILRVLQVEDSPSAAEAALIEIRRHGLEPVHRRVQTEPDMRDALQSSAWDIVLSDHEMPEFSAPGALAVLHQIGLDLPFIIVAGGASEDIAVELLHQGAHDYVAKDKLNRLVPAIERAMADGENRRSARLAQSALASSLARNRAVLAHLRDAILTLDAAGRIESMNPPAEVLLGHTEAEMIGVPFPEALADPYEAEYARLFCGGAASTAAYAWNSACEVAVRLRDNSPGTVELILSRMPPDAGFVYLVSLRDISARKRAEDQIRQLQKMEAIGRFAASVAHDFNNMLTATTGFTQLLLMKMAGGDPLRRYAEQILKACDHASQLTRQLLSFGRKQGLSPEVLDLNAVIHSSEMLVRRLIGEDLSLAVHLDDGLWHTHADRSQIEQVLLNLAANSRDATPRGGTLTIETANCVLGQAEARERFGVQPGAYVLLTVRDSGVGMDPSTKARIFEPFFTTKERGKGTGLGLATVYGIVEQSGGHIEVDSEPGQGTRFDIYLPRAEAEASPVGSNIPIQPDAPRGSETILLAEDEDIVRALVRGVLESCGYRVLPCANAEDASRTFQSEGANVHLLLTDVVMPGTNGYDLAARLRQTSPKLRVLFMSGHTESALLRHGVATGELQFLQKPFPPLLLAQRVRQALDEA